MSNEIDGVKILRRAPLKKLDCPRCGAPDSLSIDETNFRGKLRWYESVNCDHCGLRSEADGVGFPPAKIKELILKRDGYWTVKIEKIMSLASVVKILQSALLIDRKAAVALARSDSHIVFEGTSTESLWLAELLKEIGEHPIISSTESGKQRLNTVQIP